VNNEYLSTPGYLVGLNKYFDSTSVDLNSKTNCILWIPVQMIFNCFEFFRTYHFGRKLLVVAVYEKYYCINMSAVGLYLRGPVSWEVCSRFSYKL